MAHRERQDGAAAVEFALTAPLLILFLFGIVSYGYLLSFRQSLSQGAAEGARAAAIWPVAYDASQKQARETAALAQVDEALASYGVACGTGSDDATCRVTWSDCDGALCASVEVSYPYRAHPLVPRLMLLPLPETLAYEAETRAS